MNAITSHLARDRETTGADEEVHAFRSRSRGLPPEGIEVLDHRHRRVGGQAIEHVVDTTGAGDVFNGSLGARLAAGDPLRTAVEHATVAGALSTREAGARGEIPAFETVRTFMWRRK